MTAADCGGIICIGCKLPFQAGAFKTAIALGPGPDPDQRERARQGLSCRALAVEVCWTCATGE